ncbi:MAG: hypothetical protein ACRYGK_09885 [Janthinobacterium lividum]
MELFPSGNATSAIFSAEIEPVLMANQVLQKNLKHIQAEALPIIEG